MGSLLAGWLEAMLPMVKADGGELNVDGETFANGLAASVKGNDNLYPPDWRLSYKGRAKNI